MKTEFCRYRESKTWALYLHFKHIRYKDGYLFIGITPSYRLRFKPYVQNFESGFKRFEWLNLDFCVETGYEDEY